MTFQPIIPLSGYAGWSFLQRTRESQQEAFEGSATIKRDIDYFREKIGNVKTAEELVSDRRLLSVALGAFGLDEDINNKFFVQTVLDDGTLETDALANRLADKRYLAFSKAFGFGDFPIPNTVLSDFPDKIIDRFQTTQFEVAVGNQDENLRLAMSVGRELEEVLARDTSDDGKWYAVMGSPALRAVFEKAFGLPTTFGAIDIEQQLTTFREKSEAIFGTSEVAGLDTDEQQDKLIRLFLLRSEINTGGAVSSQSAALVLLQGAL